MSAHAAVVLAAGGSRRLGRPKQLLTRDGETLVHRAARLAVESGAARVLVVGGARAGDVRAACAGLPVEWILNPHWEEGLAASLRVAAAALAEHDAATLLLACDQPALETAHLRALLAATAGAASGCAATHHEGGRPGIPAVLSPALLRMAQGLHGDRGFRDLLDAVPRGQLGVCEDARLAHDVDTPDDVAHAVARGWLDADAPASQRGPEGRP